MNLIQEKVDLLNQRIDSFILSEQKNILEHRSQQIEVMNTELQKISAEIDPLNQGVQALVDDYNTNLSEARYLEQKVKSAIEEYNADLAEFESETMRFTFKREEFNARIDSYNLRVQNYNDKIKPLIQKINSNLVNASEEVRQSIRNESDYLDRELERIEQEGSNLRGHNEELEEISSSLKIAEASIEREIQKKNAKFQKLQLIDEKFADKAKLRNKYRQYYNDKFNLEKSFIEYFDQEFEKIDRQVTSEIGKINQRLEEVSQIRATFNLQNTKLSEEEYILSVQKKINGCLDEIKELFDKFYSVNEALQKCLIKFDINRLITAVILDCTNYHFDETNEYAYKGSTYNYYQKSGLVLMLLLTNLLISKKEKISNNELLQKSISEQVDMLKIFSDSSTKISESEILYHLEPQFNKLFSSSFNEKVKKIAE